MSDIVFRSDVTVELVDKMGDDTTFVRAARVSTNTDLNEIAQTEAYGLINFLIRNRHASPFEHASMTFRVEAPIFVFREWMRHRVQKFNEMSGRYTELPGVFYLPGRDRPTRQVGKTGAYQFEQDDVGLDISRSVLKEAYVMAWDSYQFQLRQGIAKEVARMCLPVGIYSQIYVTCDVRNWLNFLVLRTEVADATFPSKPQYEIRLAADKIEKHVAQEFPIAYAAWVNAGRIPL